MNKLYILGLDVVANIVKYITDPRDLKSLYKADPWLFVNIFKRCVTKIYIDPEDILSVSPTVFNMCPRITSARCVIKFSTIKELKRFLNKYPDLEEACIKLSSRHTNSMFNIICDLFHTDYIDDNCYRIERYNKHHKLFEDVWIGRGKLCLSTVNVFSYLYLCSDYVTEIMVDPSFWEYNDFLMMADNMVYLDTINYPEYGFYPASSIALYNMLTINDYVKAIKSVPTAYIYDIDDELIWDEIDDFIISCAGEVFPCIETLYLPICYIGYQYLIEEFFPNLKNIGIRYVCQVKDIDIVDREIYLPGDTILLFEHIYENYLQRFEKIKVYLYLSFPNNDDRMIINRNPEYKVEISLNITSALNDYKRNIEVYNMNCKTELIRTLDDWLFQI